MALRKYGGTVVSVNKVLGSTTAEAAVAEFVQDLTNTTIVIGSDSLTSSVPSTELVEELEGKNHKITLKSVNGKEKKLSCILNFAFKNLMEFKVSFICSVSFIFS